MITVFLDHLERDRHNSFSTRNLRLAAIHSLFRYAALRCPKHAALIQRVLAIPNKRPDRPLVTFLTSTEQRALLAAPDRSSWLGRRDHRLLQLTLRTGLRVSEMTSLTVGDVVLGTGAHVRCLGKGRKERCTPLTRDTVRLLTAWLRERTHPAPEAPLFPTRQGQALSTDAVTSLLAKHLTAAARSCPTLAGKHVTPHTLRHSCAMDLLDSGADTSVIALWLGHADTRSTAPYLHADLQLKERTLARVAPTPEAARRYRPTDQLLAFLEGL